MKVISLFFLIFIAACASQEKKISSGDPIQDEIQTRQESYKQCYEESDSYKGKDDIEKGNVVVNFIIDVNGKVQDEKVEKSDFKDANLHACLMSQLRMLKFKPRERPTNVTQQLNFFPAKI